LLGSVRFHLLHFFLDAIDDGQRRHGAVLEHEHQHRTAAVYVNDVLLRRTAVAHLRHVMDIDHRIPDGLDRQFTQRLDRRHGIVEIDRIFERADFFSADGSDDVLRGERIGHVLAREARARSACGSMSIWTSRNLPPNGYGMAAPGTVTIGTRTKFRPRSNSVCSGKPLPDKASWMIGTVEAL